MELKGKKLELDLEELMPLLIANKQEAFRHIGEKLLNSVLEKEFESFIGASKHERSDERSDYRNGHKERQLKTTLGELNLLRPYARSGKFETKLFENYSRIDKALVSMIVESYLKGVSTRKVESVISELGIELSHATVSNLSHELDELITEFRTSPLRAYYPYLYTDSAYLKVFNGSRFVSMAVMIAVGVNEDGYREILDIDIIHEESYATYKDFFDALKERGLKRVDLVISDGHKGIKKAAASSFVGSSWQLCSVHFKRNLMKIVPKKILSAVLEDLNDVLKAKDLQEAHSAGHAIFTLSLGYGAIMIYSASLPKEGNLVHSSLFVIAGDTIIALIAGLVLFTFLFQYGAEPAKGPGLVFISLPAVFFQMGIIGNIFSVLFFLALAFAGLTSAVSLVEPMVQYLIDKYDFSRFKAAVVMGLFFYLFGIVAILSQIEWSAPALTWGGKNFFDWMDYTTSSVLLPIAGLAMAIFVGYVIEKERVASVLKPQMGWFFSVWYFSLRYIAPIALVVVLLNLTGVIKF